MTRARAVIAGFTAAVVGAGCLVFGGVPAANGEPAPDPTTGTPDVLILHTDTSADAGSAELRDALDELGATVRHSFPQQQTVSVELPESVAPSEVSDLTDLPGVAAVERPVVRRLADVPNDEFYKKQSKYLGAVQAPAAWSKQSGSKTVTIAVVDTGIDVNHPDLRGKVVGTYNAETKRATITDTVGHGTFVAGVAAADTGNGVGVAGAGYNTSLLGVKIVDGNGDISIDDEIAGIRWAADHHADVINLSLSGPDPSSAERQAIQYAQHKGSLVVAAAGNDGTAAKQYPAAYPGVVSVGATDAAGHRARFSNYGSWVTLAAPGTSIYSTAPTHASDYYVANYDISQGTSFSSPLVAGAAALLKAQRPELTNIALHNILVASAHGYAGLGLGSGQVDFDRALAHVPPRTVPVLLPTGGTSGPIRFAATSTATRVAFQVDGDPRLAPVQVTAGTATLDWPSYGYGNGAHSLKAYDCTEYGECNATGVISSFVVDNPKPTLTTPTANQSVSGRFDATAAGPGGGMRLLVGDGAAAKEAAFVAAAPYEFSVNASAFKDGSYDVRVQSCTAAHRCAGPTSDPTTVKFASLHPAITGITRSRISPDGNGTADSAVVTFTLPEAQSVSVETRRGATLVRSDSLGTLSAGRHTWTWRGLAGNGRRLRDGNYQLALVTRSVDGYPKRGEAGRAVVVDTTAPRLSSVRGAGASVYPARDGYRDLFTPSAVVPDGGRLTLTVRSGSGRVVRTLSSSQRPHAHAVVRWNGRTAAGRVVPAGTYRWRLSVSDSVGNTRSSAPYRVYVSAKRLRTRTVALNRFAATKDAGGTAPCAHPTRSVYGHGVALLNACREANNDVSYARFAFHLPAAHSYRRLVVWAHGRSVHTSELSVSFQRADGGLELPGYVRVPGSTRTRWLRLGAVGASGHVLRRTVYASMILSSRYAPRNDIDVGTVQLRVTYTYLG